MHNSLTKGKFVLVLLEAVSWLAKGRWPLLKVVDDSVTCFGCTSYLDLTSWRLACTWKPAFEFEGYPSYSSYSQAGSLRAGLLLAVNLHINLAWMWILVHSVDYAYVHWSSVQMSCMQRKMAIPFTFHGRYILQKHTRFWSASLCM